MHVLLVAFYFPPLFARDNVESVDTRFGPPSVGGLRPALLAKYLPLSGHKVTVITRAAHGLPERERISEHLQIIRISGNVFTLGSSGEHGPPPPPPPWIKIALCRVRDEAAALATKWFGDPALDINWLWARRALRRASTLLHGEQIDVVWSSSPPEAIHELGLGLAKRFNAKFIADFRDGWLYEPLRPELQKPGERRDREARMEAETVRTATHISCSSTLVADDLKRRYPAEADRVSVIRNSADPDELMGLPEPAPAQGRALRLVYAGRLSYSHLTRTAQPIWQAIARLFETDVRLRGRLTLEFAGEFSAEEMAAPGALGLADCIRFLPALSRRAALALEAGADACLLITASGHLSAIPGKTFELMALNKPILALCEAASEPAALLRDYPWAQVVSPTDVDGIARVLQKWLKHMPCPARPQTTRGELPEAVRKFEGIFAAPRERRNQ